jgi:hypothetical protein
MVELVLKALQVFDGCTPAMAKAWLEMNNMKKCMFSLRVPIFNLAELVDTSLETQFMKRWDMILIDLYYADALLDPF